MAKGYVLYNPLAGNGNSKEDAKLLELILPDELQLFDVTRITNYPVFLGGMEEDDFLVIVGGDGTLHRFANDTSHIDIRQEILYFPTGTNNDFAKDLKKDAFANPFPITKHWKDLPSVEVKGKTYRFINGVGFGIDGYSRQAGDELKKIPGKMGNAKVTVDKMEYTYQKVWMAAAMYGRYHGGMLLTPEQDRSSGKLSLMLFHGVGRLGALCVFPGIIKGKHAKYKDMAAVHTGREITVEFDQPALLRIDGEIIPDVTKYTVRAAVSSATGKQQKL